MRQIEILDTSLRDGAQAEGIFYSLEDKLRIAYAMDQLGIGFIEAGNPHSNPKDMELFRRIHENPFRNAKLVAFGATRKPGIKPEEDVGCVALAQAGTEYVSLFGKSWSLHVTDVLKTSLAENLSMIHDTVAYFTAMGKQVFFDAEHFFDGYQENPAYALQTVKAAEEAGAVRIVLCDTNGGCFPQQIYEVVQEVKKVCAVPLGIHCHNDMDCAVASSLLAVDAGCDHVQGTLLGYGERCGNAHLSHPAAEKKIPVHPAQQYFRTDPHRPFRGGSGKLYDPALFSLCGKERFFPQRRYACGRRAEAAPLL